VTLTNCPNGTVGFPTGTNIRLVDKNFTDGLFPNMPFSVGQFGNRNITGGFSAINLDNTIVSTSGANNFFVSEYTNLAVGGLTTTHANIYGNLTSVSNRATSTLLGGTDTIEGFDAFVNIETPATTGYGVFAYASTGSADAAGTGTISAINGTAGIHNGGATLVNAGEFRIFNAISTPLTPAITTGNIIRARMNNIAGNTITALHGLSFDNWSNAGTVSGGSVIFADNTVDVTGMNYFINSASAKPSKLAGDVYVSDNTKGIILKSPDNTCYRFTVANGGALNAGVSVTCP
jgi:hypothetical protein